MNADHEFAFEVPLAVAPALAVAFVRDVGRSLAHAHFLRGLQVEPGSPTIVAASLPINAALFGQRDLPFRSALTPTEGGARLAGLDVDPAGPGWACVSGEAIVRGAPAGSVVRYELLVSVHVDLPEDARWGGRALTRMIEYTAEIVLGRVTAAFPEAIARAGREFELARSTLVAAAPAGP